MDDKRSIQNTNSYNSSLHIHTSTTRKLTHNTNGTNGNCLDHTTNAITIHRKRKLQTKMRGAISYNWNMVFVDATGQQHIFTEQETRFIQEMIYKKCQKKGIGISMNLNQENEH